MSTDGADLAGAAVMIGGAAYLVVWIVRVLRGPASHAPATTRARGARAGRAGARRGTRRQGGAADERCDRAGGHVGRGLQGARRTGGGPHAAGAAPAERAPPGGDPAADEPGWTPVLHDHNRIGDPEEGVVYAVLWDGPRRMSHHAGFDAQAALVDYLAIEATARVIERRNAPATLGHGDLTTLRTVRPDWPEPPRRVALWPQGGWIDAGPDVWRIEAGSDGARSLRQIRVLAHALRNAGDAACVEARLTYADRSFDGYRWYRELRDVTGIAPDRPTRRRAAQGPGVHVGRRVRIEVRAGRDPRHPEPTVRRVEAPLWIERGDTLIVAGGVEPTVEMLVPLLRTGRGWSDREGAVRAATELLSQAGERSTQAGMEETFRRELQARVGGALEVEVRVRPAKPPA